MKTNSRRLSILTAQEIEDLYALPRFTEQNQQLYFELSAAESQAANLMQTAWVKTHFILQLGYFKAKRQFFRYQCENVIDDLRYIVQQHFPERDVANIKALSKPTRLEQQQIILKLFDYTICSIKLKEALEQHARLVALRSTQPIYILREMLQYLWTHRIVAPGYTVLQDLVSRVLTGERKRITQMLALTLTPEVEKQLQTLLESTAGPYPVTLFKHQPKDFTYQQMRHEVECRKFFEPLYDFAKTFLLSAGLSNESVKYYASLVEFYTVYKLQRMLAAQAQLYLLCFAYHRFQQINDNLIDGFIHLVDRYENAAKMTAKENVSQTKVEVSGHLKAAGQVLNLFVDNSVSPETPFRVAQEKAFSLLDPTQFHPVSEYLAAAELDQTRFEWAYYAGLSHAFKLNIRHLFSELEFGGRVADAPLLKAVTFLQEILRQGRSPSQVAAAKFPIAIIPKTLHKYLFDSDRAAGQGKRLKIDCYEFLVYRLLRNALEAGDLFVQESNEFRRFEDDLISDARWQNKEAVLSEIGAPILMQPIGQTLHGLRQELEAKFVSVNERITAGENRHFKLRGAQAKRRWSLIYPRQEEPINNSFYEQLPGIGIADLLGFVNTETAFLNSFTHVLDRYVKHAPDQPELLACIIAMGTNMGVWKMAEVSDLSRSSLLTTARNYLRPETLHAANDVISNATARLSVTRLYDIAEQVHSSSDGQRFETQIDTINARYSSKYFGLKKGVSAYTLVANHVPINARIIGAHDHESHYVFDLLYNNTTEIIPESHSTDTHGTNQVNFWILHVFGYRFAPRYRDLHKKMDSLVGFDDSNHDDSMLIKPARKINESLIHQEWPTVQRIMASLAQKDVTQATIVRKLSSYTRQNQTKKALWELESIYRTLYILDFIDDVILRQSVQKALNRGEAYHRLRRAIAYVNSGKFRVRSELEQQIWNECSRLIANAIIYYNALILSRVLETRQIAGDEAAVEILKGISPVAWQHVNLFGQFDFEKMSEEVNIESLAERFNDPAWWSRIMQEEKQDGDRS